MTDIEILELMDRLAKAYVDRCVDQGDSARAYAMAEAWARIKSQARVASAADSVVNAAWRVSALAEGDAPELLTLDTALVAHRDAEQAS